MQQEMLEPRADRDSKQGEAVVIESEVNRYTGVTCMTMVQWGTLRVGDAFVAGTRCRMFSLGFSPPFLLFFLLFFPP